MATKYQCPKCGRRFTEWGAEKLGFKCPQDQYCPPDVAGDIELVRVGGAAEPAPARKPSLKRSAKKRPAPVESPDTDELMAPDTEALEESDEDEDEVLEDEEEGAEAAAPAKLKLGNDDEDDEEGDDEESESELTIGGDATFEGDIVIDDDQED